LHSIRDQILVIVISVPRFVTIPIVGATEITHWVHVTNKTVDDKLSDIIDSTLVTTHIHGPIPREFPEGGDQFSNSHDDHLSLSHRTTLATS
jgi:hypothetical protein